MIEYIKTELQNPATCTRLEPLLAGVPELAEIYENLNYEAAGLCRSPLDASVRAEQAARQAIAAAGRQAPA